MIAEHKSTDGSRENIFAGYYIHNSSQSHKIAAVSDSGEGPRKIRVAPFLEAGYTDWLKTRVLYKETL